ncbi:MAG TPA: VCBS repeat-containing protein, partial [Deltaproteobacteria bacterium]|nr:VCBS repeat-containing protein [Deltaproteobacteria bacterium]HQB39132.1 VCBS repeat-containing protein [Deltaproteobacteria bacterium]
MKRILMMLSALLVLLISATAFAAPVRVFVSDMSAIGVQNKAETKTMLQALLAARLNSDKVMSVGAAAEADAIITGNYIVIGKVYSMDAMARTSGGKT